MDVSTPNHMDESALVVLATSGPRLCACSSTQHPCNYHLCQYTQNKLEHSCSKPQLGLPTTIPPRMVVISKLFEALRIERLCLSR